MRFCGIPGTAGTRRGRSCFSDERSKRIRRSAIGSRPRCRGSRGESGAFPTSASETHFPPERRRALHRQAEVGRCHPERTAEAGVHAHQGVRRSRGRGQVRLCAPHRGRRCSIEAALAKNQGADERLNALRLRAWQHAIFELGYFRAMLGDGNACVLAKTDSISLRTSRVYRSSAWRATRGLGLGGGPRFAKLPVDV